ncbi:MAG: hypothetical protein QOF71_2289, partial [Candidatus Eremiobacteraeota bacterium]|nr:hypothetical protein [Candidatus Eremiobacteraeota bacterium]
GSTLSHELFETITDPDVQTNVAWYNNYGGEIGDICRSYYGNVTLTSTVYDIQKEYTNVHSACSFSTGPAGREGRGSPHAYCGAGVGCARSFCGVSKRIVPRR